MCILAEIQRELLDKDVMLRIDAEILVPRVGGYNARPYSCKLDMVELPRASELKALWRWWLRVTLSAVFGGQKDYEELDKEVGTILGSTEKQSVFKVIIDLSQALQELEQAKNKLNLLSSLLKRRIPTIVDSFVFKYRESGLDKAAKLKEIRLLPISISFKDMKKFDEFKQRFKKEFGLAVRKVKRRGRVEARCEIRTRDDLLRLLEHLNYRGCDEIAQLYDEIIKLFNIPRITLLKQPRKEDGENDKCQFKLSEGNYKYLERIVEDIAPLIALPERLPIKIIIVVNNRERLYQGLIDDQVKKVKLAIATLFLSLLLGGLGSITRRGFGSIVLKQINYNQMLKDLLLLQDIIKKVNEALDAKNENELKSKLIDYISRIVLKLAYNVYGKEKLSIAETPKVPTLTLYTDYFKLDVIECKSDTDSINILECIGKAVLKSEWKRICRVGVRVPGGEFHTWILGLPRSMGDTGYFIREDGREDRGRRSSAIALKILENREGKKFVIVYGFLSRDWPIDKLIHKGKLHPRGEEVVEFKVRVPEREEKDFVLKMAFNSAFKFVTKIVRVKCRG